MARDINRSETMISKGEVAEKLESEVRVFAYFLIVILSVVNIFLQVDVEIFIHPAKSGQQEGIAQSTLSK